MLVKLNEYYGVVVWSDSPQLSNESPLKLFKLSGPGRVDAASARADALNSGPYEAAKLGICDMSRDSVLDSNMEEELKEKLSMSSVERSLMALLIACWRRYWRKQQNNKRQKKRAAITPMTTLKLRETAFAAAKAACWTWLARATLGASVCSWVGTRVTGCVGSTVGAAVGHTPLVQSTRLPSGHNRKNETTQCKERVCVWGKQNVRVCMTYFVPDFFFFHYFVYLLFIYYCIEI